MGLGIFFFSSLDVNGDDGESRYSSEAYIGGSGVDKGRDTWNGLSASASGLVPNVLGRSEIRCKYCIILCLCHRRDNTLTYET
jgi:hypothetical protein